ncbi:MAG TPA: ABC transporter permease, partial [Ktedonobacteraceae bacterium]|nr:ABC transporter permease [Ktedonobacteraceae bacterium]
MTQLLGIPLDLLAKILVIITVIIIGSVVVLAIRNRIFFKIGVRNIPRRRTQMVLIVFALMLSTTLLTGVLATGDVIEAGVQTVAVYNLGTVDETITGGHGALGTFDDYTYRRALDVERQDPNIAAVGAALVENNLLVADETSRQVRSSVTALALLPNTEKGFGGMKDINTGKTDAISALGPNEVYLNQTMATLTNAHVGDTLYLYSQRWEGKRYQMQVRGIVADGGLVGQTPYILSQYSTFLHIEGYRDALSEIYIALRNPNDPGGVDISDQVQQELRHAMPGDSNAHVSEVKEAGVKAAQTADDIFSRIFGLFALFALSIGLLLIFLIFVLLAAERRAEMGMARAIGVQRRHLVLMYVFEGTVYDLISSFVGLVVGTSAGAG